MPEIISPVELRSSFAQGAWTALEEALHDRELIFRASSLRSLGFQSTEHIIRSVERAMSVCSNNGLPIEEHFKAIYISDNDSHSLSRDWKLSRLAYTLAIINGGADNPVAGRLQLEVVKQYLSAVDNGMVMDLS